MIAIQHPVNRQIFQYYYLKSLIERYQDYVKEWLNKTIKDIKDNTIAFSEGDNEIEASMYSQESNAIYEITDSEDLLFYKAMLIMVYSYYEGVVNKMAEDAGVQGGPSSICVKYGKVLSKENKENATFLYDIIRLLKNHLCHNDSGTKGRNYEKTAKALKYLSESRCIEMDYQTNSEGQIILEKCSIYWINKDFIIDVLEKEHDILIELSEIAGYKNTYIGKHEK